MSFGLVAFSVFAAAWLAFCIWTVRRLLLRASAATRREVLRWGIPWWLVLSVVAVVNKEEGPLLAPWGWWGVVVALVVGFPFGLWGGYFFNRTVASATARRPGQGSDEP